jgi:hypothetical protein
MASTSGSLSVIQFHDPAEMTALNRKDDNYGISSNSEISPSCLPSKKSKRLIIVYPSFVPD